MEDHYNYDSWDFYPDACLHNMLDDRKGIHAKDIIDKDLPYHNFSLYE